MHLFAGMYVEMMIGLGYSRQPRQQGAEVNFILFILARRQMGAMRPPWRSTMDLAMESPMP